MLRRAILSSVGVKNSANTFSELLTESSPSFASIVFQLLSLPVPLFEGFVVRPGKRATTTKLGVYFKNPKKSFNSKIKTWGLLHDRAKALILPDGFFVKSFL
jgi:hypothetical protein